MNLIRWLSSPSKVQAFFAKTQLAGSQVCSVVSFGGDPVPSKTGPVSRILILISILLINTADVQVQVGGSNIWLNGRTPECPLPWSLMASIVSSRSGVSLTWWCCWATLWHNRAERGGGGGGGRVWKARCKRSSVSTWLFFDERRQDGNWTSSRSWI